MGGLLGAMFVQGQTYGKLTVLFTKGAGLENPETVGTYRVTARVGGRAFAAPLTIVA